MLKKYAPSQIKKRKRTNHFEPTPNQEGCIDDDFLFQSDSEQENSEEDSEDIIGYSTDEDSIEDYIAHLEDIRRLSEEEFLMLKEDIRKHGIE